MALESPLNSLILDLSKSIRNCSTLKEYINMELVWKGLLGEILLLPSGVYRLYCDGISENREKKIIELSKDKGSLQSRIGSNCEGALIIDFEDCHLDFFTTMVK